MLRIIYLPLNKKCTNMKESVFVTLYVTLWCLHRTECVEDPLTAISKNNWRFADSLYGRVTLSANTTENVLFSPLSLHIILAMCYAGAKGETANQILKILELPQRSNLTKLDFNQLFKSFTQSGNVALNIGNIMCPALNFDVLDSFISTVHKLFLGAVQPVDFRSPTTAAQTINQLAMDETNNTITNVVTDNSLSSNSLMVLINAIYFKGDWEFTFDQNLTSTDIFLVNGIHEKYVEMMHLTRALNIEFNDVIKAHILELPYKNKTATLVIVLPIKVDDLPNVEARLDILDLREVLESDKPLKNVTLSLPRFTLKQSSNMDEVLMALGVKDMFGEDADFSGMTGSKGLHVNNVEHNAMIEVTEEGTEATAVSSEGFSTRLVLTDQTVVVDHPFVFALISRRPGVVLFVGRYTGEEGELPIVYKARRPDENFMADEDDKTRSAGSRTVAVDPRWWHLGVLCLFRTIRCR